MTVRSLLVVAMLLGLPLAAEETAAPEPAIRAGDQVICSLGEIEVANRPGFDAEGLPVLPFGVTRFDVVAPLEAQKLGVRPRGLRLVRVKLEGKRRSLRVVPTEAKREADRDDAFRLELASALEPGSYRFGLESPDLASGTEMQAIMRFFGCGFEVAAPAAE